MKKKFTKAKKRKVIKKPPHILRGKKRGVSRVTKKKKGGKVKKTSAGKAAARAKLNENVLAELIEKGRPRGFVTDTEILYYFPNIEEDLAFLEEIYDRLEKA